MNKKGFTLIELLVTIVLLGLISFLGVTSLMKLVVENSTREFEYYGSSMIAGAKLYIQKEGRDLVMAHSNSNFTHYLSQNDLINGEYLQPFRSSKKTNNCNDSNNGVKITYTASTKTYTYSFQLTCVSGKKQFKKTYNSEDFTITES